MHLTKNHAQGPGFAYINCPGGRDLTGAGKLQKFNIRGLFLPKIAFSVSIESMKQNLLSVSRTVKYAVIFVINLLYGIDNLRNIIFQCFPISEHIIRSV